MGDGYFHGDHLLGPLLFLNVVGPQDDPHGAAQTAEWGVGVWSHRIQPRGCEGQVAARARQGWSQGGSRGDRWVLDPLFFNDTEGRASSSFLLPSGNIMKLH